MTGYDIKINMNSPSTRNPKILCKINEHSDPVQNNILVKNHCTPKKDKDSTCTWTKNTLKSTDCISDVGHKNSFLDNSEQSHTQTSSSIVSNERSHQKKTDSGISSYGCVESVQSEPLDISCTKKQTRQGNKYSTESLKEHTGKNPFKGKEENVAQLNSQLPCEYKNAEGNNCEGATITEMYETSASLPLNTSIDCSTDDAVDKKKERWKMKKKLAKDERRKQRELEYKKNLQPKEQRIQVIDQSTFQKILKDAGSLKHEDKKSLFSSEEFPTLNVLNSNNRFSALSWQDSPVLSDIEKSSVQDKTTHNMEEYRKIQQTRFVTNGEMINKTEKQFDVPNIKGSPKKMGKLPKKRDPIQIDILECIKIVKSKDAEVEPKRKLSTLERRKDSSLISGNELDSSNPQRSRGKKRENPKKKRPTRLKLVIQNERMLRDQLKKLPESNLSQAEKESLGIETSSNLSTAGNSKSEVMEPVTHVLNNEVAKAVTGSEKILKECRFKCEVPSSESITAVAVPDLFPSLPDSASEALKKEKEEFNGLMEESCYTVNLKQDKHSLASAVKPSHISSDAVKLEILNNSQDSLETFSFTDPVTCNELHPMDCKKFPKDKVCDSSTDNKETVQNTEIHSRKFRPYCDHFITPEINSCVSTLLQDIIKFHDRQFLRDPVKANARRRHVTGLREVLKYLNLKRLKLIIIAPDMELIQGKGGICDIVEQLKEGAQNQEIPYVFALHRRALGKRTFKKVPVSCVGIINYDGTEKNFHSLVTALHVARAQYQEALTNISFKATDSEEVDINKQVIEAALSRLTENSSTCCFQQSCICSETDQKREE